jgi:hypothetical protein
MNEAIETYNQFSDMTEVFSWKNAKLLWKYLFLFGQGCLMALKIYIPVFFSGTIVGYLLGKAAVGSQVIRALMQGPLMALAAMSVAILFPLHFFIATLFQIEINPFITIPIAFSLMNIVTISRTVTDNIDAYNSEKLYAKYNGDSILKKRIASGLVISQAVYFNVILFITLVIATDIFEVKKSSKLIPTEYNNNEIYWSFILFFGITVYIIKHLAN